MNEALDTHLPGGTSDQDVGWDDEVKRILAYANEFGINPPLPPPTLQAALRYRSSNVPVG